MKQTHRKILEDGLRMLYSNGHITTDGYVMIQRSLWNEIQSVLILRVSCFVLIWIISLLFVVYVF